VVAAELEKDVFLMTVTDVTAIDRDATNDTRTHLVKRYVATL